MKELNKKELLEELRVARGGTVATAGMSEQAYKQIKQLISQPERQVDEKYIDEKAKELWKSGGFDYDEATDFIRYLLWEVQEIQKPKITKERLEMWIEERWHDDWYDPSYSILLGWLVGLLKEAGCEVEE